MLALAALLLAAADQAPALPDWMAGCWETRTGSKWAEECWTVPRAGMMMGSGRSGDGEQIRDWEVMQIVRLDTDDPAVPPMTFYGAPSGQNRTPFTLIHSADPGVTFVNAEHDYPQRIRYWRDGDALVAEVALKDGSKSRQWRYTRIKN